MTRTDAPASCSRHEGITGRKAQFEPDGKAVTRTTRQDFCEELLAKADAVVERANLIDGMYGQMADVPTVRDLALKAEGKAGGMVEALEMLLGVKVKYTEKRGYYIVGR